MELINEILKYTLLWLLLWQTYILVFNRGVPNIKTAPGCRKRVIACIKEEIENNKELKAKAEKGTLKIVDLGSGNGRYSRHVAKLIPQAHVTGLEISKLAIKHARFMQKLFGVKNLEYKRADIFEEDWSGYDVIIFFLSAYEMGKLSAKLSSNTKDDVLIISNRFKLHHWTPAEKLEAKTIIPRQGKIFVYRRDGYYGDDKERVAAEAKERAAKEKAEEERAANTKTA